MTSEYREMVFCEVCGNTSLISVLDLGLHPMCDDLVPVGGGRICREYPIEILFCRRCNTGHQRFQVPKEELFPATYHYRSRFTADVLSGMAGLVDSCVLRFGNLSGKKVLDVGCNDGSLLDFFKQKGAITLGVEPTNAASDAMSKGHVTYNDYLSESLAEKIVASHGQPDFITFTNVFAHIEDLQGVLRSLKILMAEHTTLLVENHYLGSVLDGNQFDTFYHEHPRTYSYGSFARMAQTLGTRLAAVEFPSRYGGNIRVFLSNSKIDSDDGENSLDSLNRRESEFFSRFASLRKNIESWRSSKLNFLKAQIQEHGPLRAKAFPGRAAILVKLLGLNETMVSAVYEKPGSLKIGHYLPGTRIPICSDAELFTLPTPRAPLLNLAWHIPGEIRQYMTAGGYAGPIVDILGADDFDRCPTSPN